MFTREVQVNIPRFQKLFPMLITNLNTCKSLFEQCIDRPDFTKFLFNVRFPYLIIDQQNNLIFS